MRLFPEHVEAIQFWREHKPELARDMREGRFAGVCPYCKDRYPRNDVIMQDGQVRPAMWCICQIAEFEQIAAASISMLHRPLPGKRAFALSDLQPVNHAGWARMVELMQAAREVIARPWDAPWITIMGAPGCGKSHLLSAIYQSIPHLAAYVYADAFADDLRQAIANNSVGDLKDAAVDVPVLILDDLGTEYGNSDYIRSTFNAIISQRYMAGRSRPTLIATNHNRADLIDRYSRMADRMLDRELAHSFVLNLPSWRTRGAPPNQPTLMDYNRPGTNEESQ